MPDPDSPSAPPPRRTRRTLAVAGVALLGVAAVFAAGVAVGWRTALHTDQGALPDTVTVAAAGASVGGGALVPDVRGLARVDALQALADAGIPAASVDVANVPSALAADAVLRQSPPGGAAFTGSVAVDVAAAGTVPDLVGKPTTDARSQLEDLGAQVTVTFDYAATAPAGSVLAVDPAPGTPLKPAIRLTAAADPASVYVAELSSVSGGGSSGEVGIGGTRFAHGLQLSGTADYLVNKGVQRMTGTVGTPDDGATDAAGTVVVRGDGRELARIPVRYGASAPLAVDLTGVLRVSIEVTGAGGQSVTAALGDLLVIGSPAVIDGLGRR